MPATKPETAPTPDPTSEAAAAPAASPAKSWVPMILTAVLMPAVAFAMTQYVLVPQLKKSLGITAYARTPEAKGGEEKHAEPGESVVVNKLLVNVAGTMGARYLLVSLSVVGSGTDFKAKMSAHEPQLRDFACGTLATKTLADLEKPGARNLIRTELISGFNSILRGALVQEIYLTEFAIQ